MDQLVNRSDLVLGASVLFAEGWWKVRSSWSSIYRAFFELAGFIGAAIAVFFSSVMLFSEIANIVEFTKIGSSEKFTGYLVWIEIASVVYALLVRVILLTDQDLRKEMEKDNDNKLEYFEKRYPEEAYVYEVQQLRKKHPNLTEKDIEQILNRRRPIVISSSTADSKGPSIPTEH